MTLSDSQPLLLHNPKCSKSRAAKAWLEQEGVAFTERLYLKDPLDIDELRELHGFLGEPAREWVRSGDAYKESGLTANSSAEEHYAAIVAEPSLLQRPIFVSGGKAAIGRPLEKISELV